MSNIKQSEVEISNTNAISECFKAGVCGLVRTCLITDNILGYARNDNKYQIYLLHNFI